MWVGVWQACVCAYRGALCCGKSELRRRVDYPRSLTEPGIQETGVQGYVTALHGVEASVKSYQDFEKRGTDARSSVFR
jgi:hypothetical protein